MSRFRTEYGNGDSHAPAHANGAAGPIQLPKPPFVVQAVTTGRLLGHDFVVTASVDLRHLPMLAARLSEMGFKGQPERVEFQRTPEGLPLCPKHGVAMRPRGKGTDRWHSHAVSDGDGRTFYCKGYPGPDSQGFELEGPDPEGA